MIVNSIIITTTNLSNRILKKYQFSKQLILILFYNCTFLLSNVCFAQARLIINNGAIIVLNGGSATNSIYLVVDNANPNAITRNTTGHIISESEFNKIKWNIGNTAGTYTIPYGIGTTTYIPNTLSTSGAAGGGNLTFSTYPGNWLNSSYLPTGVTNFLNNHGLDNSWAALDRFWRIEPTGYTTKPALANLIFTYRDIEHTQASNAISEAGLTAQRYNFTQNSWDDYMPGGTDNATANNVTVASLPSPELHAWWVLVDAASVLPIELSYFNAACKSDFVALNWQTTSEQNNNYFEIERSENGNDFTSIGSVISQNGNSVTPQNYSFSDNNLISNKTYYRLKQVDLTGNYSYSSIISVTCNISAEVANIILFPNPVVNELNVSIKNLPGNKQVTIYNSIAQVMANAAVNIDDTQLQFNVTTFAKGTYILRIDVNGEFYQAIKFVKK